MIGVHGSLRIDVEKHWDLLRSDFIHFADTLDCLLSSPSLPITEALYDMISHVLYDMIRSQACGGRYLYDRISP